MAGVQVVAPRARARAHAPRPGRGGQERPGALRAAGVGGAPAGEQAAVLGLWKGKRKRGLGKRGGNYAGIPN